MFAGQAYALSNDIIHDPEFVRMEKEFGEQWNADDALVRAKLAKLEETDASKQF